MPQIGVLPLQGTILFRKARKRHRITVKKGDNSWAKSLADMRSIGNFLVTLFSNNIKALGDYGFVVADEVPADKKRFIDMKMRERKLQVKVKIGSPLSNTGKTDFYIYKGKLIEGIFIQCRLVKGETVRLSLSKPDIIKVLSFIIRLRQAQADTPFLMEYYWKTSLTKRHWVENRVQF